MKSSKLHALASSFAAYLLDRAGDSVRGAYLFGSVARWEATEDSDIDIFVDAIKNQDAIKRAGEEFESTTIARAFRAMGVKNPIRALVGNLGSEEFADVRLSIAAEGFVLYGRALPAEKAGQPYLLVWFEAPRQQKQKVAFLRRIFGRTEGGKTYAGMVQWMGGFKAGAGTAVIPIRYKAELLAELRKAKVNYQLRNVWLALRKRGNEK